MAHTQTKELEKGNIYFFYRPKVQRDQAKGVQDIQRFYMVLDPQGHSPHYRLMVLGRKRLPEIHDGGEKVWGFVQKVSDNPKDIGRELGAEEYATKTRGRRQAPVARPAGEGVYEIVQHGDHTHLAFELELPEQKGQVQKDLNIEPEGSYILSVKNPEKPSPRRAGLRPGRKADFPKELQRKFENRRFFDANPPEFLDYEGAEVLLVGAAEDVSKELGIELDAQDEDESKAEIFNSLRLEKSRHPVEPLFKGQWK